MTQPLYYRRSPGEAPAVKGSVLVVSDVLETKHVTVDRVEPGSGGSWAWGTVPSGHLVRVFVAEPVEEGSHPRITLL